MLEKTTPLDPKQVFDRAKAFLLSEGSQIVSEQEASFIRAKHGSFSFKPRDSHKILSVNITPETAGSKIWVETTLAGEENIVFILGLLLATVLIVVNTALYLTISYPSGPTFTVFGAILLVAHIANYVYTSKRIEKYTKDLLKVVPDGQPSASS